MGDRYNPLPARRSGRPRPQYDRNDRNDNSHGRYDRPLPPRPRSPPRDPRGRYDDRYNDSRGGYAFRGAAAQRDSYQPQRAQDTFSFQAPGPRAPRFPSPDRQRPLPQRQRQQRNESTRKDQGRRGPGRQPNGRPYGPRERFGRRNKAAHARDILQRTRGSRTPELLQGMNQDEQAHYMAVDSSSEDSSSDGNVIDLTKDSDDEMDDAPRKRVKTHDPILAAPPITKWSNPDPYTALPPTEALGMPKKDIVQVIRKAKIDPATKTKSNNAVKDNADFISLNFDDDFAPANGSKDKSESGEVDSSSASSDDWPPSNRGSAPSALNDREHPNGNHAPHSNGPQLQHAQPTFPSINQPLSTTKMDDVNGPPPLPPTDLMIPAEEELVKQYGGGSKGKKRKHDEQSKETGTIVPEWQPNGRDETPWCTVDHSHTADTGLRLHKEICDFYDFVSPQQHEEAVRRELIGRIQSSIRAGPQHLGGVKNVELRCFGSFAAGLYLPTADMDLVAVSQSFLQSGNKTFCQSRSKIYNLARHLVSVGMATEESMSPVVHARVPIVKFVDSKTGIKVDISFENDSGLKANKTFMQWKEKYPVMPVIVVLIKQFLAMRGLNEVFSGGLGGFSIICLVVHLLDQMPEVQSGSMDPRQDCGAVLLKFLDLYGKKWNLVETGIVMNPPGTFNKKTNPMKGQNATGLTIMDPNNPQNDISGGSRNIDDVFNCFTKAYSKIQHRLHEISQGKDLNGSILGCILAGNYSSFVDQRRRLSLVHSGQVVGLPPVPEQKRKEPQRKRNAPPPQAHEQRPQRQQKAQHPQPQRPIDRARQDWTAKKNTGLNESNSNKSRYVYSPDPADPDIDQMLMDMEMQEKKVSCDNPSTTTGSQPPKAPDSKSDRALTAGERLANVFKHYYPQITWRSDSMCYADVEERCRHYNLEIEAGVKVFANMFDDRDKIKKI